jgi:hypothetical protein
MQLIEATNSPNTHTVWIEKAFKKLMRLTGFPVSLKMVARGIALQLSPPAFPQLREGPEDQLTA